MAFQTLNTSVPEAGNNSNIEEASLDEDGMPTHPDLWTPEEAASMLQQLGPEHIARLREFLGPVEEYVPAVGERRNPLNPEGDPRD